MGSVILNRLNLTFDLSAMRGCGFDGKVDEKHDSVYAVVCSGNGERII